MTASCRQPPESEQLVLNYFNFERLKKLAGPLTGAVQVISILFRNNPHKILGNLGGTLALGEF